MEQFIKKILFIPGFILLLNSVTPASDGFLKFAKDSITANGYQYSGTIRLSDYTGVEGIKGLQFKIIINQHSDDNLISSLSISKGSDLSSADWALFYEHQDGYDYISNSFSDTVIVLLFSTGKAGLKENNYKNFLELKFDISNPLSHSSKLFTLSLTEITASYADGTGIEIIPGNTQHVKFVKKSERMTNEIFLANYPNPFNPVTTIRCEIPEDFSSDEPVTLKIFDVTGREIEVLSNEKRNPGIFEVRFDGTDYPSGVYIYSLSAGQYLTTKKLVILR